MKFRFLGTGTSVGVPQIGCTCRVCTSKDPRDRRRRCGAYVRAGDVGFLIDTPPEVGAGTGLLYLLRWFWMRINAWSEISAMIISFLVACFFQWGASACGLTDWLTSGWRGEWLTLSAWKLLLGVAVTTVGWLVVTFLTPREPETLLKSFYEKVRANASEVPRGLLCMACGCLAVWSCLFGVGYLIYGIGGVANALAVGAGLLVLSVAGTVALMVLVAKSR